MINNRQAGRRRGRNNSRPQGNGRGGDSGNRIDSRARGNATQLLEKYKNLARDAQTQGDRVSTEYYLQFADHYFRVLADNRARQEEQQGFRRNRDDNRFDLDDEDDQEFEGDLETGAAEEAQPRSVEEPRFERRPERQPDRQYDRQSERYNERQPDRFNDRQGGERGERNDRGPRRPRRNRDDAPAPFEAEAPVATQTPVPAPAPLAPIAEEAPAKPKRAPRAKRSPTAEAVEDSHGLDAAILPPSISRADNDSDEEEAPRKRTRRARPAAEAAE